MDRIITDNSKVNENLLNEVNTLNKQNKELIVKNMDLQEQLLIQRVSQRSELLRVFDSFYDWHEKQGYVSVKRDDFEEYLKTLNCG